MHLKTRIRIATSEKYLLEREGYDEWLTIYLAARIEIGKRTDNRRDSLNRARDGWIVCSIDDADSNEGMMNIRKAKE